MSNDIVAYLKDHLKKFVMSSGMSVRSIAKEIDVDYQRLYRFHAGKLQNLTYFEASRLSKFLKPDGWKTKLKQAFPSETHDLQSEQSTNLSRSDTPLKAALDSIQATEVFVFISGQSEVTADSVAKEFGFRGNRILKNLLENGAIIEGPNGCLTCGIDLGSLSDDSVKAFSMRIADLIDTQETGYLQRFFACGFNDEGLKRVYGICAEASAAIVSVSNDPSCSGEKLYLGQLLCGRMTTRNSEAGE